MHISFTWLSVIMAISAAERIRKSKEEKGLKVTKENKNGIKGKKKWTQRIKKLNQCQKNLVETTTKESAKWREWKKGWNKKTK